MNAIAERAIDHTLARWVRARSGSDVLARSEFAVSRDEGSGHVCSALAQEFDAADIAAVRVHPWVGDGSRFSPFVLDDAGNFYTWRNWRHETRLAAALRERALARTLPLTREQLAMDAAELFAGTDAEATRWQRAAVAAAPGARVFVLTGGPGTGKTTTALRILLMLTRHAVACGLPETPSVALAAPTGKAAQRLGEAIAAGAQDMARLLAPDSAFRAALAHVAQAQPQTLHRVLDFNPHENTFGRGANAALPADVVLVDEVSMVDIAMMRRLVEALRPTALLILLGDAGQLYAIEAGSVLSDIVGSVGENALPPPLAARLDAAIGASPAAAEPLAPLAGQVLTLTHAWRAGGALQRGLGALRTGDASWLDGFLREGRDGDLSLRACVDSAALRARVQAWIEAHAQAFAELMRPGIAASTALQRLREMQILCALR